MKKGLRLQSTSVIPIAYILSIAVLFSIYFIFASPIDYEPVIYSGEVKFNATRAYWYAYKLAKDFPYRPVGSEDTYKAFRWIEEEMRKLGHDVYTQEFTINIAGLKTGRNVYAIQYGELNEAIAVLVNYDMVPMSYEAASDTAGHVGVVMELANSLREYRNRRSIVYVFVDSEEWGMQGARYFVKNYEGPPLKVVIVSEDLAVGNLTKIYLESMGQFRGYSPLWLRVLSREVGDKLGIPVIDPVGFEEYLLRTIDISFTDQGPILAAGIPSIEISTRGDAPELARRVYHTREDRMEYMERQSFNSYGRYLVTLILSLDMMQEIPNYQPDYLIIDGGQYLPGYLTYLPPLVLLIPLIVHLSYILTRDKNLLYSLLEIFTYFIGFSAGFILVSLSPLIGLVPTYDTYPPPPRHPYLYSPSPIVFLLFLTPPSVVIILLWRRKLNSKFPSHSAIIISLLITAISSILYNKYGTITLLSQVLLLWPWIPSIRKKVIRVILLIGGVTIFLMLLIQFGQLLYLGPLISWYLLLGVAYGQFKLMGNLIFSLIAATMVYILRHYILTSKQV